MTRLKVNVPAGFFWSHTNDRYEHADGRWFETEGTRITRKSEGFDAVSTVNPETLEEELKRKGKTGPRVTMDDVEAAIAAEHYSVPTGTLTICVLTLKNGYTVSGESACADPANFDEAVGRRFSREDAKKKIWPLLGYELRTKLQAQTGA